MPIILSQLLAEHMVPYETAIKVDKINSVKTRLITST
jgi:hypothetical protein